jgi:hypothetical protein
MVDWVYQGDKVNRNNEQKRLIVMHVRNVDEKLKNKFKAYCIERGKTLSEELQRLMREELERRKQALEMEEEDEV